jgi:predicted transcriptional regulator
MTMPRTPLDRVRVHDVMHTGLLMTDAVTPLTTVAHLMADQKVHSVAVADNGFAHRPLTMISTLDVAAAVAAGEELTAGQASRTEVITVRADQWLDEAAALMVENQVEHLLVIDPASGYAEGTLSTLDVAGAFGGRP